jgi:hypothetical protein
MKRLYQWFSERASLFHSDTTGRSTDRTVRTEVTVHQEGGTLMVGGVGTVFDVCPFCHQKLDQTLAEHPILRPQKGSANRDCD